MWYTVAAGALINMLLIWMFDLQLRTHLLLGGAISFFTVLAVVAAGAFYPDKPAALWATLLGDKGGLSLPEHASIAVLPFNDLSAIHDQQYLADGIAEELITGLAKFPDLIVMARNSTFTYKDKPTDVRQVGKDLNVRTLSRAA